MMRLGGWLETFLIIVLLFVTTASCSILAVLPPKEDNCDSTPGKPEEAPKDREQPKEETRQVTASVDLLMRKFSSYSEFWVRKSDGSLRPLAGQVDDASLYSISEDRIELICRGWTDDGWQAFPYLITYSVKEDIKSKEPLFLDCRNALTFGNYVGIEAPRGHAVSDIHSAPDGLFVQFRVASRLPISKVPETQVSWLPDVSALRFVFLGTQIDPGVEQDGALSLTASSVPWLTGYRISAAVGNSSDAVLEIKLSEPVLYNVEHTTGHDLSMTIRFRALQNP